MKLLTLLFGLGILTTLLVSCHAGPHQRSLEKSRINNTKEEISLLKQDVLDLITSTLNPSKHSTKTEASNHVTESITQPTFQPITLRETELTGEQLQKIPEDTPSIEVKYEQKISLKEESPKTDSANSKNETIKRNYNNLFMFKFNQSKPFSHTSSEVTLSQSSYEQSSVVYEEEDEDHSPEYEDFTRTAHSKYERKKKKKEILDMVTVPTQWSSKKQVNETNKEKTQTDALDDRPSTTSNKIESNINSLDVSLTTISNKENILSQSGNNVISHYNNDSSTKKPRMTYSVKKSAVINDTSTVSSDIAGNTVPVLKWEKATTKPNIDSKPINVEIEKSSVVKSNVEFKHRLGLNPIAKVNTGDDVTETSIEVVLNTTSKYLKDIQHHKLAKNTLEEVSTSTAWIPVATLRSTTSYKHLTKPATTEKVIPTETVGKVKEMIPWLTRLQRSSTTALSSLNANQDSITVNPKSIIDSETSSSWKKFKTTSTEEESESTTSSITTEMIHNSTEPSNEDNITLTVDIISDKPLSSDDFSTESTSSERDVAFTTIRHDSTMENISTSTEIEAISESNLTLKDITTTVMNKVESVTDEMAISTTSTPITSITNPANKNVSDVTNSSGNKTLSLDMNQTSNDLKVNNTDMKTDLNKVHTIKTNDSIHESVLDDDILEDKALTDEFDDETKKRNADNTH
uniref:Uncharacterized protein n=1 Tax=Clastoptera arizonana TaxID=38151 RepID=A0A1B6DLI4_9HEMI